ncbi:hypothetical protein ACFU5O_27850 [Streptomyces sp. NPDC057445]|uniref:hypothetical protein n=1 Tax=Streptomyces sp. NPDC057445 TaxID=3346136 RepID=UPI0036BF7F94
MEERASVHRLLAPKARSYFVSVQDAACPHLNGLLLSAVEALIGIRAFSVGIAAVEDHRPCPFQNAIRREDLIEPTGQLTLARGILTLLNGQDHVAADQD